MQLAQFLPVYFESAKLWLFYFLTCQDNNKKKKKKWQDVIMFGFYCAAASFEVCGSVGSMWRHPLLLRQPQVCRQLRLCSRDPPGVAPPTRCGHRCEARRDNVTAVLTCNSLPIRGCYNVMILYDFFFFFFLVVLLLKFFVFFRRKPQLFYFTPCCSFLVSVESNMHF